MRALVVWTASPADVVTSRLARRAVETLLRAGHEVEVIDLAEDDFQPVMGTDEWRAYRRHEPLLDERTAPYAEAIVCAELLVFVYRTSWFGLPVRLKGFLERTFVPGVAFALDAASGRVRGRLHRVRHLVAITTNPASRRSVRLLGDPGRRTLLRTLRLACPRNCRSTWLGLYGVDRTSDPGLHVPAYEAFFDRVDGALGGPSPVCTTVGRLLPTWRSASRSGTEPEPVGTAGGQIGEHPIDAR